MNDSSNRVSPANTVKLQLRNSSTHTLQHTTSMFLDSLVYREQSFYVFGVIEFSIVSGPNRIPERQRVFQASDNVFRSTAVIYRSGRLPPISQYIGVESTQTFFSVTITFTGLSAAVDARFRPLHRLYGRWSGHNGRRNLCSDFRA